MAGDRYILPVTCARCDADLELLRSGAVLPTESRAVARYTAPRCQREWLIFVRMTLASLPQSEYRAQLRSRKGKVA